MQLKLPYIFSDDICVKDVPTSIPKSDLLGVIVALVHVAAQRFVAVRNGLNHTRDSKLNFENC